ncbi:uncharacterized protein LOC121764242 [Salvia splendens]|uniref:uncharacterized protein LOC121764242 n=1 Tax=Salvia splendens TaxID=180675 RepID=UPI001C273321|nr:uncharacterized protein LOC121764242 [Salvia splendens]
MEPPDQTCIKLNKDGSFMEATNKAGGGGIIRDHSGNMLVAFCTPLDAHSALEAELMPMIQGLDIAKDFGLPIWLESDAEQAIKLINGMVWGSACVRQVVAKLSLLKRQLKFRATFIHREGNKAADLLARKGLEQDTDLRMQHNSASRDLLDLILRDAMGVHHIRDLEGDEH